MNIELTAKSQDEELTYSRFIIRLFDGTLITINGDYEYNRTKNDNYYIYKILVSDCYITKIEFKDKTLSALLESLSMPELNDNEKGISLKKHLERRTRALRILFSGASLVDYYPKLKYSFKDEEILRFSIEGLIDIPINIGGY